MLRVRARQHVSPWLRVTRRCRKHNSGKEHQHYWLVEQRSAVMRPTHSPCSAAAEARTMAVLFAEVLIHGRKRELEELRALHPPAQVGKH